MNAVIETKFSYKGNPCVVKFMPGCYRCGYVGLYRNDKFFGEEIPDAVAVGCHGGIAYSEPYLSGVGEDSGLWWIGFDCGHCFDGYDIETAKQYFGNNPDWVRIFGQMEEFYKDENKDYEIQTLEYVKNECRNIVDQIVGSEAV